MLKTSVKTLAKVYKRFCISLLSLLLISSCATPRNYYFYSDHLADKNKAAFLYELVHSLHLNNQSQLLYRLYGNWQFSLTPTDLDLTLNGICQNTNLRRNRKTARKDISYYNFFSDIFDQEIQIFSRKRNDCGYELYLEEFIEYPKLDDAAHLALNQFKEIAERLEALYFNKQSLGKKYDDIDQLTKSIDDDIASLSAAGFKLAESTKKFFELAKLQLVMKDVANVRSKGLGNLKTFSDKIKEVKLTQYSTIEEATLATIKVLEELNRDINQ